MTEEAGIEGAIAARPRPFHARGETRRLRLDGWPDLLALHQADPQRYPCLLESAGGGGQARYDLLLASTGEHLTLRPEGLEFNGVRLAGRFLDHLDRWWRANRRPHGDEALPFHGGWFVFLGYELVAEIEPRIQFDAPLQCRSIARAERCPAALIRDHATGEAWLVAEEGHDDVFDAVRRDVQRHARPRPCDEGEAIVLAELLEDEPQQFLAGVDRIKRFIRDGDVFQVNLSRAWCGRLPSGVEGSALYRRLRSTNPAPFAALARIEGCTVVSSSPERLVRVRAGMVETRPIAGTHPRGADPQSDGDLAGRLLAHPKERAEHIMLIDLERNDLGKVCAAGSVVVDELMALESYAHVHHIVSNIRGRLAAEATPGAVIRAVFPGGTITGCPKVRCMEIIRDLERCRRGAYTGALGYLDGNGDLDLNILIRTLVLDGDAVTLRAGAGIVADSVPERELAETRAKARGLLRVFADPR